MGLQERMDQTNQKNSFMVYNFIRLTKMEVDSAVVELDVQPESKNLFGGVHGGVFLTMADCASGAAARSRGKRYVTLSNSFEFFRNTKEAHIYARSKVRYRGSTICVVAVDVTDNAERLLASGTFTMFCTGDADE